jgi:ParB family transcriptional regulator, chromosome partitioning protein
MAKPPIKLSGLLKSGTVVAKTTAEPHLDLPAQPEVGRNLRQIAVHLIDANPMAPREVYTTTMVADRAEALRTQGQHDPIHVVPHPDVVGRFMIADGWTRVLACLEHKVLPELLAEVHADLSLEEAAWFGYQQNEERQQHCDLDRAVFYEKLIAKGSSANEVARRAKLSKTLMSFYRGYAKLPEDVLEIVRGYPDKFSANIVYQLAKLHEKCGLRRTVILTNRFANEDHTRAWLISQVQGYLNPTEHKAAAPSKQVRYSNGYFKQRGDVFEVSIAVTDERRSEFAAALEALLDTVGEKAEPLVES